MTSGQHRIKEVRAACLSKNKVRVDNQSEHGGEYGAEELAALRSLMRRGGAAPWAEAKVHSSSFALHCKERFHQDHAM